MEDYKQKILDALETLKKIEQINKEPFKVRAYENVISQIKQIKAPIYSREDLKEITGIGKKIGAKLDEIFATGKLESAERAKELMESTLESYTQFLNIYGVGPTKAKELINTGILSIEDLREKVKQNPNILNQASRVGLRYYEDFQERIPRSEMELHDEMIHSRLLPKMKAEIVGSYRRGLPDSGDLDVLITIPNISYEKQVEKFQNFLELLQDIKYLTNILSLGERKCLAVCKIGTKHRRIDFLLTPPEEFPYALLYFTGSKEFNIAMRNHALELGWSLSEHGMKKTNGMSINLSFIQTEKDIFTLLNLKYRKPENRIDERSIIQTK